MKLSVIVPVLDEAAILPRQLAQLARLRAAGAETIVVDGGSSDGTGRLLEADPGRWMRSPPGRARQMNAGAAEASGDVLLFLHADTELPPSPQRILAVALHAPGALWGRFDVEIAGRSVWLPLVAFMMNTRSRLTGIATGDQAIFVTKSLFTAAGGYPEIALMEDVELSKRLKRFGPPLCLKHRVTTSGRRWEKHGVLRTILLMWRLRLAYWLGADPGKLAIRYDRG